MELITAHPASFDPTIHDAGDLHRYLTSLGHGIEGITVTPAEVIIHVADAGNQSIGIMSLGETSVLDDLEGFTPEPSEEDELRNELAQIDLATADLDDVRRAVALMRELYTKGTQEHDG